MARIVVTADSTDRRRAPVVLDERVLSIHLSDGHAADQLIERLGWAISDAEELERSADRPIIRASGRGARAHDRRGGSRPSRGSDRGAQHVSAG
ncbi:MAG TPA: hypothetical protein VMB51_09950 [Solirubrobacteraceae bacterium]|nr:hypothetical protein [Solirubrobacteraceae bacterium]